MSHDQPAYARVPGIRVYGMMCNSGNGTNNRNKRIQRSTGKINISTSEKKEGNLKSKKKTKKTAKTMDYSAIYGS